jgi:hypothetical protein
MYRVAGVAIGGDLAKSTTELRAGVPLGLAPCRLLFEGNLGRGDAAARNDGRVLGGRKAGEGRNGNEASGVQHDELISGEVSMSTQRVNSVSGHVGCDGA